VSYHPERRITASFKEYLDGTLVPLPQPTLPDVSLDRLLRERASCRRFAATPIGVAELGALLFAAYGTTGSVSLGPLEQVNRTVPSGGGLYPLELYVLILNATGVAPGIYHYQPLHHGLEPIRTGSLPRTYLAELFMGQPYVPEAACLLVTTAIVNRSMWKYEDRGYRYILFEAGHVAQNLGLTAAALGLAALHLGGFFDFDLAHLLEVDHDLEVPLYVTAIGAAETNDPALVREPRGGFGSL
jgi:SagB-type dehydrogenase family enzyme